MRSPPAENGVFEGGILFVEDYRQPSDIVAYSHAPNRLGVVLQKKNHLVVQFLAKRTSSVYSLPFWDEIQSQVICSGIEEAQKLAADFASRSPAAE